LVLLAGQTRGEIIDPYQPPLVGQPEDFERTGAAVGPGFRVSMRVQEPEAKLGEEFTLTVRIQATGRCERLPRRPRLDMLKPFHDKKLFQFARLDKKSIDKPTRKPDGNTWEFDYKVKPLSESIRRVPAWTFVYWKPSGSPVIPGRYESPRVESVPLTVKPKPTVVQAVTQIPIQAPAAVFQLAEGPDVLRRQGTAWIPDLPLLIGLLLAPPIVAIGWYVAWRRLFPDAARKARIRRSLAARQALQALSALGPADPSQRAFRVARIAAGYLQQRLGLPTVEPTPAEVGAYLSRAGAGDVLAGKAAELFRACDVVRFAPAPPSSDELAATATDLILTLEAEPWSARAD
jgi:hypothetical protein